jgi:hypothetical protein
MTTDEGNDQDIEMGLNDQDGDTESNFPFIKKFFKDMEYEIVLENLTPSTGPGSSQPFSPPVLATHRPLMRLFKKNGFASDELRQIAEDAVNAPMVSLLQESHRVFDVVEGSGVILPGAAATFTIKAKLGFRKLSLVTMLVNTNDAFTGTNKVFLPFKGSRTYYLKAYDAGTEQNTELQTDIPGPCCGNPFSRVPTSERIKLHEGILGIGDLAPATYGWNEPVAKLTVTRIN